MTCAAIENMVRGWNRDPMLATHVAGRSELAASLWRHMIDDRQEVSSKADPDYLNISLVLSSLHATLWHDDRLVLDRFVHRGQVTIVNPGVNPRAIHTGKWDLLQLFLPRLALDRLATEEGVSAPGALEIIDPRCGFDPVIERIGCEVVEEMRIDAPLSRLKLDLLGLELGVQLIRKHSNRAENLRSASGRLAPWQRARAEALMRERISDDLALDDLAEAVGLSRFHFARCFRSTVGLPPHRFLLRLRMESARRLLGETNRPVTEIAAALGYADPGYFAKLFKREVGLTPMAFRRERRS